MTPQDLFQLHREASREWLTADARRTMLKRLWQAVLKHEDVLVKAMHEDLRKPATEVHLHEMYPVKAEIKHAVKHLGGWMVPMPTSTPLSMVGTSAAIEHQPKGHVLIVSPWNFPVILTLRPLISAIAAGNRCIVKPSEHTPNTSEALKSIIQEALPQEVAAVVLGGPEVSASLTAMPFQHICFTGGTNIGKKVMKAAADNLASVTLELGGKSPAVVDATAHLQDASRRLAWGKCLNNGQVCIAPDYALVEESIAPAFLEAMKARFDDMYGSDEASQLHSDQRSQIVNDAHFQRVVGLIEDAVAQGAEVIHGGTWDAAARRIAPTLLTGVTLDMKVMQEEIFGPVLPVMTWRDPSEVQTLVQANPHPLAMYFFSKNETAISAWMRAIPAGTTGVNEVVLHVANPNLPFGGIQTSGIGRTGGLAGFEAFSNMRSVLRQTSRFNVLPWTFPPFNGFSLTLARVVQRWL